MFVSFLYNILFVSFFLGLVSCKSESFSGFNDQMSGRQSNAESTVYQQEEGDHPDNNVENQFEESSRDGSEDEPLPGDLEDNTGEKKLEGELSDNSGVKGTDGDLEDNSGLKGTAGDLEDNSGSKNDDDNLNEKEGKRTCGKRSVVFVLDKSYSMHPDYPERAGGSPLKMSSVKEAAAGLIDKLHETDAVGLVSFALTATKMQDLTLLADHASEVKKMILGISAVKNVIGTNIYDAVKLGGSLFETEKESLKIMVLLSDGKQEIISSLVSAPQVSAEAVKKSGVRLITIGFNVNKETKEILTQMASTDSDYRDSDISTINQVFEKIGDDLCR